MPPGHDIITVGTSAGGVEALIRLVKDLPPNLPAALFIVLHIPEYTPSALPSILSRAGALPATHPRDKQPIECGHIYVAPPGVHLLIEEGFIRLSAGPRENRHRPAIDPLFRTAAVAYGPRVIGVILTGALNDGTAGLRAIKRRGGIAVVQDPADAHVPSMPMSALNYVDVDQCLPLADIPRYLQQMAHEPAAVTRERPAPKDMQMEADISGLSPEAHLTDDEIGRLSVYTCPECKGPLWEIQDGKLLRFRCQVGHAYTSDALMDGQAEAVDHALWTALETLEQRVRIVGRLAARARENKHFRAAARFDEETNQMSANIETLRSLLLSGGMRMAVSEEVTPENAEEVTAEDTTTEPA